MDQRERESCLPVTHTRVHARKMALWERSGLVVESLTGDRGTAGSSLTGVTALCP